MDEILKYDQLEKDIKCYLPVVLLIWCTRWFYFGMRYACKFCAPWFFSGCFVFFFFFWGGGGGGGGLWKISPKVEQGMMGIGGGGIKKGLLKM